MPRWTTIGTVLVSAASLTLAACDKAAEAEGTTSAQGGAQASANEDLFNVLDDTSDLSTAAKLMKEAGLEKALEGVGSYTVFAPTDEAIAALPEGERKALESDEGRPQLLALVSQHLAPGYISRKDLDDGLARAKGAVRLASTGTAPIEVRKAGNDVRLGEGDDAPKIVGEPLMARNGVIYRIDRVLPPPK